MKPLKLVNFVYMSPVNSDAFVYASALDENNVFIFQPKSNTIYIYKKSQYITLCELSDGTYLTKIGFNIENVNPNMSYAEFVSFVDEWLNASY